MRQGLGLQGLQVPSLVRQGLQLEEVRKEVQVEQGQKVRQEMRYRACAMQACACAMQASRLRRCRKVIWISPIKPN
jgi:hypothetical protein